MTQLALTTAIVTGSYLLRWLLWLAFCRWLVVKTGSSKSLIHAATAARAFPKRTDRWKGR